MPSKKIKEAFAAIDATQIKWTFEVTKKNPKDFAAKLYDEHHKVIMVIVENDDYNQLSRLLNTSKYMKDEHDMKGLSQYVWDRNLLKMDVEEKEKWNKKKVIPIVIKEVIL